MSRFENPDRTGRSDRLNLQPPLKAVWSCRSTACNVEPELARVDSHEPALTRRTRSNTGRPVHSVWVSSDHRWLAENARDDGEKTEKKAVRQWGNLKVKEWSKRGKVEYAWWGGEWRKRWWVREWSEKFDGGDEGGVRLMQMKKKRNLGYKRRLLQFGPRENYISGSIPLLSIKLTLTSFSIK